MEQCQGASRLRSDSASANFYLRWSYYRAKIGGKKNNGLKSICVCVNRECKSSACRLSRAAAFILFLLILKATNVGYTCVEIMLVTIIERQVLSGISEERWLFKRRMEKAGSPLPRSLTSFLLHLFDFNRYGHFAWELLTDEIFFGGFLITEAMVYRIMYCNIFAESDRAGI